MPVFTTLAIAVVSSLLRPTDGARLLLVVDSMNSHVLMSSRLGLELAKLGHDVDIFVPSNARVPDFVRQFDGMNLAGGRFNYTTFAVDNDTPFANSEEYSKMILKAALMKTSMERLMLNYKILERIGEEFDLEGQRLIENVTLMDDLKHGGYQHVIVSPVSTMLAVPLRLGVPYSIISLGMVHTSYRIPRLASFTGTLSAETTDRMTFVQRLVNLLTDLSFQLMINLDRRMVPVIDDTSAGSQTDTSSMSVSDAFRRSSLWLLCEDPAIGYPMPLMPNTIPVGDLMAGRPGLPLPLDLESFFAESNNGVVVFSFGSYLDDLPDYIINKFCDAFQRLPAGRHVIWKLRKSAPCSGLKHVKTVPWIPQNDLLADQRVRLFVSHGGMNSLMETIYHAKPVIVFPLYVDQPANAVAVVSKGLAVRMDISDFTSDSLLTNIEKMFSDRSYETNARRLSSILRDRRDTPAERASHMLDHVIKYGDGHLRTGAYDLNLVQFLMFDLFAVLYSIVVVGVVLGFVVCRQGRKCFGRRRSAEMIGKDKCE